MILANETRGTVLADELELARSTWTRFVGLMGRRDLPDGQALVLEPGNSIHMFFMRFPVDVAFIDGEGKVVHMYNALRPWRVSRIVRRAKAAIELPSGALARAGVGVGDLLTMS